MPVRLALSLHAADEALRSQLMPVNERYPLRDVIEACRELYARKRRRVFVEYVMLAGVNDRYEQALALADALSCKTTGGRSKLSHPIFKVNLIPYNPIATGAYEGSSRQSIAAFRAALESRGIPVTVRLTRGRDIDAACGQLAARAA
jgi:23S rRNA (adenine2503-C2)-methyltransferase